jgi:hypothetical protein
MIDDLVEAKNVLTNQYLKEMPFSELITCLNSVIFGRTFLTNGRDDEEIKVVDELKEKLCRELDGRYDLLYTAVINKS